MTRLTAFNCAAVGMTLLGGLVPAVRSALSRAAIGRMFALRSGILLSVALVGILPEAARLNETLAGVGALAAFLALFAIESASIPDTCCEFVDECHAHRLGPWALAALFLHSFLDGFNLSAAFAAGQALGTAGGVALLLHKLADGFTLTSLLEEGGYPRGSVLASLAIITLATPLGSALSFLGLRGLAPGLTAALLAFSGGSLLYIAASAAFARTHKKKDPWSLAFFIAGAAAIAAMRGWL
ncbi:MAG: ZIP family metal transporter [Elusimicrobia bacterium]|nr:ZIP family metal transporter [Elusimicrobiota bacterium]